jgi:hypothetical protein
MVRSKRRQVFQISISLARAAVTEPTVERDDSMAQLCE